MAAQPSSQVRNRNLSGHVFGCASQIDPVTSASACSTSLTVSHCSQIKQSVTHVLLAGTVNTVSPHLNTPHLLWCITPPAADDPSVFTFSLHCRDQTFPTVVQQSDWDIGLPAGTTDQEYIQVNPLQLQAKENKIWLMQQVGCTDNMTA